MDKLEQFLIFEGNLFYRCGTVMLDSNRLDYTVKSHFKALGFYNFKRGFGRAYNYKTGGLYPGELISGIKKNVSERPDKTYLRNELKLTYHYI